MSDVRDDIERALRESETVNEDYRNAAKGAAALGGGILVGRYLGKKVLRAWRNRQMGKTAMDHVRMNDAVHNVVKDASSFDRFRSSLRKSKRK